MNDWMSEWMKDEKFHKRKILVFMAMLFSAIH